jgi:RHS repeat-associated protein
MLTTSPAPTAELGLDLVRHERAWYRLPRWDPRLWQPVDDGLQCAGKRDARHLSTLGVDWARRLIHQRSQRKATLKLTPTRPSHGRPQRSEDGRKGGGTARAGSTHSARRQATTLGDAQRHAPTFLPSTRARAEQAGGGHKDDVVNNPTEIRDWRIADEWPAGAKPVTRKIQYDDLYRVKRLDYEYAAGDDDWTSPFASELAGSSDPRRAPPSPHVSFSKRILWQTYNYDWLGNTSKTDDDAQGFYDRSLGTVTNDTANDKPYHATNDALGGTKTGNVDTVYDAAGNLTRLDVERNGTCLGGQCSQSFEYRWDEVGRLVRARRWDVAGSSLTTPSAALPNDSEVDADLEYVYDASDDRVLKTAHSGGTAVHTAYVFDTLELRRTTYASGDYAPTTGTGTEVTESEVPYLFGHGVRLARVVYEQVNDGEPRLTSGGRQHVFFELGDHLGSTSVVLDKETSELVERGAWQAYGAKESDYRADRWKGFREDYGFTGKEEDVEVGLAYFGKRFLSPYLGRWVSADPLGVHVPGEADANLYAYVLGQLLRGVDPLGLECGENETCRTASGSEVLSTDPDATPPPASPPPAPAASQGATAGGKPQKSFLESREVEGITEAIDETIDGIKAIPELPGRITRGEIGLGDLVIGFAESLPTSQAGVMLGASIAGDTKEVFKRGTLTLTGIATLGANRVVPRLSLGGASKAVPGMAEVEAALDAGLERSGAAKPLYRNMSAAEAQAVRETGLLRGGRPGETYWTDSRFRSAATAQDRLSLPGKPEVQMEFQLKNSPLLERPGTRVDAKYGGPGGGREYMSLDQVEVEVVNVQPYVR